MLVRLRDENISFNFSSTGIPENHKNRLLPRSSAEPAWESLATEFLLVCEHSIKGKDLLFYGLLGEFCCILIHGWICDTFGRRRAILISNIIYASATGKFFFKDVKIISSDSYFCKKLPDLLRLPLFYSLLCSLNSPNDSSLWQRSRQVLAFDAFYSLVCFQLF